VLNAWRERRGGEFAAFFAPQTGDIGLKQFSTLDALRRAEHRVEDMIRRGLPAGSDFRSLIRAPVVQGLLVATVALQAVALTSEERAPAEETTRVAGVQTAKEAIAATLPALPAVGAIVTAPAKEPAIELAESYREKGYALSDKLARDIYTAAAEFDIAPDIAFGLVRAESSFRNQATSPVGAVGLTQLMPRTAAWMQPGVTRAQLRNPETNLNIGFKYLRYLLDKYDGNENLALLAYNRGPGTVDRAIRQGRNPDNGYAAFVRGEANHGHRLFTSRSRR
jgi:soluble lytic murein transglycosylase-like protein